MRGLLRTSGNRSRLSAVVSVLASAWVVSACGDDGTTGVRKKPGTEKDAATAGQGGADSGAGGSRSSGGSAGGQAPGTCKNSLDCASEQVCDQAAGRCVECLADTDCSDPSFDAGAKLRCVGQHCRPPCTSDRQCTPLRLLCNSPFGVCAECNRDADCDAGATCVAGVCAGGTSGSGGAGAGGSGGVSGGGGVTSSGGGGGVPATGGGGGVTSSGGGGGVPATGGGAGTGGAGPSTCNRADLWIAFDISGSMNDAYDTGTRFDMAKGGVDGFTATATRAAAGLVVFPKAGTGGPTSCCVDADCGAFGPCTLLVPGFCPTIPGTCATSSGCVASSYDSVDVPLTPLPDAAHVYTNFLATVTPSGGSTLAPALERMAQRAAASAAMNPSNRTVMVLMTDGTPGGCAARNTEADVAAVATAARTGSPSIKTYVIPLGVDPAPLEQIATAGGTAIFPVPTTGTFTAGTDAVKTALQTIVTRECP